MLTYDQVQQAIEDVSERLEVLVTDILREARAAAEAETAYKTEFAKARISFRAKCASDHVKTNMDEVSDHATVATEHLFLPHLLATNNLTTLREALRANQSRLDALRTLSASFRSAGG